MALSDKIKAVLMLAAGIVFSGCYNTTVPQFSGSVKKAKVNGTLVREYICDSTHTYPIHVGEAWVEKVWFYETLGNKTVKDGRALYVDVSNNELLKRSNWLDIYIQAVLPESKSIFQSSWGYKISETKAWYELSFRKDIKELPDTIRFNIYDKRKGDTTSIGALVLIAKPEK